jgi:hypothetical protein
MLVADMARPAAVVQAPPFDDRSPLQKEMAAFRALCRRSGADHRRDETFSVLRLLDENQDAFPLIRLLDTRAESAKQDESNCERTFSFSGRAFSPLRERLSDDVAEQCVQIPQDDKQFPVTGRQVMSAYRLNAEKKLAKTKQAKFNAKRAKAKAKRARAKVKMRKRRRKRRRK